MTPHHVLADAAGTAIPAALARRLEVDVHAGPISATAVFSPDRAYRYLLTRSWAGHRGWCC